MSLHERGKRSLVEDYAKNVNTLLAPVKRLKGIRLTTMANGAQALRLVKTYSTLSTLLFDTKR